MSRLFNPFQVNLQANGWFGDVFMGHENIAMGWNGLTLWTNTVHKNWIFPLRIFKWMWLNPQETSGLVTFTKKILNGKLNFLCSENSAPEIIIKPRRVCQVTAMNN